MRTSTAIELVNEMIYKPDWRFTAEDHTNRYEGAIKLRVDYPAQNTNRDEAAKGYPTSIQTYATFPILVEECKNLTQLMRQVLLGPLAKIDSHESRESLRHGSTLWCPFHPHTTDGMRRWGDVNGDLSFGIV